MRLHYRFVLAFLKHFKSAQPKCGQAYYFFDLTLGQILPKFQEKKSHFKSDLRSYFAKICVLIRLKSVLAIDYYNQITSHCTLIAS